MEVQLKKTKITKSIIKQSLPAALTVFRNLNHIDVLGWCLLDGKKIVLLYNRTTNQVMTARYTPFFGSKYQFLKKENVQRSNTETGGWDYPEVNVLYIEGEDGERVLRLEQNENMSDADMEKLLEQARDYAKKISQGGQIYI
jgi:hypothetical protein